MTALGLASGLLSALSFLPQVLRTIRTGSADDFSFGWLVLLGAGVSGWCLYGVLSSDLAIISANAVILIFLLILLVVKVISSPSRRSRAD